jgi:glucose-6-phosphate isomerase, archaeal
VKQTVTCKVAISETSTDLAVFDPKLGVRTDRHQLTFTYDSGVFGPEPEFRRLDDIRRSLRDPRCDGPDPVYSIVMDVGREEDRLELKRRMLLFGVVAYASGRLGDEPVRSQGHIHAIAPHCGWSTPELFEIWEGRAIVYAQQFAADDPGKCVAVSAAVGEQVVVPPGWAHCVINADSQHRMVFGAWCDRQYGFIYDQVRAHHGLAWFPVLDESGKIQWERNPQYRSPSLLQKKARTHPELGLNPQMPIYGQFVQNADAVQWVSEPKMAERLWTDFEP